jgi:hypothetical protein
MVSGSINDDSYHDSSEPVRVEVEEADARLLVFAHRKKCILGGGISRMLCAYLLKTFRRRERWIDKMIVAWRKAFGLTSDSD